MKLWLIRLLSRWLKSLIGSHRDASIYLPHQYLGGNQWRDIRAPMSPWVREALDKGGKVKYLPDGRVQIEYKGEVRTFKRG